ncbi:MAG TPA: energy transducer TonB [Gemmatimonadaceae bacterium]
MVSSFWLVGVGTVLVGVNVVVGHKTIPATRETACGRVQKIACTKKEPGVTTIELKPKSKVPLAIPQASRSNFTIAPEEMYRDTEVCASGPVAVFEGHRRLVISNPQDLTIRRWLRPPPRQWSTSHVSECDEGVESAKLLAEVKPNYTRGAMEARIQGVVVMEAIVDSEGHIAEARIRQSLDSRFGLDEEAVKAVKQWRFAPATRFGTPVPIVVDIEMSFRLK